MAAPATAGPMSTAMAAGVTLLKALRTVDNLPAAERVTLAAEDCDVHISRLLALTMSPVLRAALSGAFSEAAGHYQLRAHRGAHVRFAMDFLCGDEERCIDNQNALPLLALADELSLAPLKESCETALLGFVATSNAAQLAAAAEQYGCADLLQAARAIVNAESSALGECMAAKHNLLAERSRLEAKQVELQKQLETVDSRLSHMADKATHELELIFRANSAAAGAASGGSGDAYPHAAGETLYVRPNACDEEWFWDTDCLDEDCYKDDADDADGPPPHTKGKRKKAPSKAKGPSKAARSKKASEKAEKAPSKARARSSKGKATPNLEEALEASYGSIMEAYEAAAPGSVIKLLPGRHLLTHRNKRGESVWERMAYRKSVQFVAFDGLSRDQVLVGTYPGEPPMLQEGPNGVLLLRGADVRFERLTFLATSSFTYGIAFFAVAEGSGLWLDDCALFCAHDRALDPHFTPSPCRWGGPFRLQVSHGVRVCSGARAVLRGCLVKDADGAAVHLEPAAARVLVERSVLTGCGRGEPPKYVHDDASCHCASGEYGVIEIQDGMQGRRLEEAELTPPSVRILVRDTLIEGNVGPALSFRPSGDQIRRRGPVDDRRGPVYQRARQLAQVFTVEQCQIRGNQIDEKVQVELMEGETPDVVWNRTRRGGYLIERFGDIPEGDSSDLDSPSEYNN